jgi:hypothetical protein
MTYSRPSVVAYIHLVTFISFKLVVFALYYSQVSGKRVFTAATLSTFFLGMMFFKLWLR